MGRKIFRAQGTIEYLVIIAIVVVIALIVVGLLLNLASPGRQVAATSGKIAGSANGLSITNIVSGKDGNTAFLLRNNTGSSLTMTSVKIGLRELPYVVTIAQGSNIMVDLNTIPCTGAQTVDVVLRYLSENNLAQSVSVGNMEVPCEDTVVVANQVLGGTPTPLTYTVTFNTDGGSAAPSPITGIASGATITLPADPTKTGYNFGGWYTQINGGGTSFTASTTVNSDITVYANWASYSYAVTFDSQSATTPADPSTKSVVSPETTVVTLPTAPTKTGYNFGGWYTQINGGGTSFTGSTTVSGDITVYANWTVLPTYRVTYFGNGSTGGTVPVDSNNYLSGATVTVLSNSGSLIKAGNAFLKWNTLANGSGIDRNVGTTFPIGSADVNLHAQWTSSVNTITFVANGGTGSMSTQAIASNTSANLSSNTFVPAKGLRFDGWATSAGGGVAYANGASYPMGSVDVNLYAKWTDLPDLVCPLSAGPKGVYNWYRNGTSIMLLNMPFEEDSNSSYTKDFSGNSPAYSFSGLTWNSSGGYDGNGDYTMPSWNGILVSNLNVVNVNQITFETWVNPQNIWEQRTICSSNFGWCSAGGACLIAWEGNYKFWVNTTTSGCVDSGESSIGATQNVWQHVVGTWDGTNVIVYNNGVAGNVATKSGVSLTSGAVRLGTNYWNGGGMDQARIYNRALTSQQIQNLYTNRPYRLASEETAVGETWKCSVTPSTGVYGVNTTFSSDFVITG